jgi:hypothetical protein
MNIPMQASGRNQIRIPNVEQGISNDEVQLIRPLPSAFFIRYSTCPLCPQSDLN